MYSAELRKLKASMDGERAALEAALQDAQRQAGRHAEELAYYQVTHGRLGTTLRMG